MFAHVLALAPCALVRTLAAAFTLVGSSAHVSPLALLALVAPEALFELVPLGRCPRFVFVSSSFVSSLHV